MRPRLVLPCLVALAAALTGCDLMSDPEGPSPDDFEVKADTSEVNTSDQGETRQAHEAIAPQDVTGTLAEARSGVTLRFNPPR